VSENVPPHSGSRWEPGASWPEKPAATGSAWPAPPPQPGPPGSGPAEVRDDRPAASAGRPGRAVLAAAAVGLLLAGGLGGFAVGHAIAGGRTTPTGVVQDRFPGAGTDDGPGIDDGPGTDDGPGSGDREAPPSPAADDPYGPGTAPDHDDDGPGGPATVGGDQAGGST
jgi:hypothetical protein